MTNVAAVSDDKDVQRVEVGRCRVQGLLTDLLTANPDRGGRRWTNWTVAQGG